MYQYKAKLDRVVDGDTIDVIIDLGFKMTTNQRIRLLHIDTPEIFSARRDSQERIDGLAARDYVIRRLAENNDELVIHTYKYTGKYGRYLGAIFLADSPLSLNDELVEAGHAVVYG